MGEPLISPSVTIVSIFWALSSSCKLAVFPPQALIHSVRPCGSLSFVDPVWMGHTHQIPLRSGCATAQGCQPHALDGLWLAQGPTRLSGITKIYMDDRSCTARSAQALVCKLKSWQEWSSTVGLHESFSKTRLAASTPEGKQPLLQLWDNPEQVTNSLEVLAAAWGRRQTCSAKEEDRLDAAERVIACLGNLRLPLKGSTALHALPSLPLPWLSFCPTVGRKPHPECPDRAPRVVVPGGLSRLLQIRDRSEEGAGRHYVKVAVTTKQD